MSELARPGLLVPLEGLRSFQEVVGAFGDPDGHRADLEKFISLSAQDAVGDLRLSEGSLKTRVVVGRKGSGKTLYLRMLQDLAVQDDGVYATPVEPVSELPGTRQVARLSESLFRGLESEQERRDRSDAAAQVALVGDWFPEDLLTEIWMLIWDRSIFGSLASRILNDKTLGANIDQDHKTRISQYVSELDIDLKLRKEPRSPFSFVRRFINEAFRLADENSFLAGRELRAMLDDPVWDDLANATRNALLDAPPVFMYIDAIDEEFTHKPMRWLRCQKGLFYTTMRLLRTDHPSSGRVHLVIAIRDIVLSSVLKSEHATRYRSSPHIRSLNWDSASIRAFLRQKVSELGPQEVFPGRAKPRDLSEWIGLETVGAVNGHSVDAEEFALRHTQVLPRDVVLLGNYLAEAVRAAWASGADALTEDEFRSVVERVGTACGLTQVVVAANQAIAEGSDSSEVPIDYEARQTPADEYASPGSETLLDIVAEAKTLRFDAATLSLIRERGRTEFRCDDLPSVLWQAGLLAYSDGVTDTFHRSDFQSSFALPKDKAGYVFHPTMRECAGLLADGRLVDVLSDPR